MYGSSLFWSIFDGSLRINTLENSLSFDNIDNERRVDKPIRKKENYVDEKLK